MEPVEQLEQLIRELNPVQITLLLEMARAMRREIQEDINEQSNLLVPEFATNFSNRLLIHHATHNRYVLLSQLMDYSNSQIRAGVDANSSKFACFSGSASMSSSAK
jgi:hypothetical protein